MKRTGLLALFILGMLVSACAARPEPAALKIAVLPILDSLPLYVAQSEGLFEKNGLKVELISVASAPERDQLMQAGQIDGMLNEVASTMLYNRDGTRVVIVRFARTVFPEQPMFRILSSKDSGIKDVKGLSGVPIGISEGTVIEYITDRVLEKTGLSAEQVKKVAVPKIPDRMALLSSGELKAAVLPDPLASLAIQSGAFNVVDDTAYPEISHSVWSFDAKVVKEKPDALRAFLTTVEQAVEMINADKARWGNLLADLKLVPAPLTGKYVLPDYPSASVPDEAQFADSLAWLKEKGLLQKDLMYQDMVDASFLPAKK